MCFQIKKYVGVIVLLIALCLAGCAQETTSVETVHIQRHTESVEQIEVEKNELEETEEKQQKITLMMIGDNLLHPSVVRTGYKEDGSRDYSHLFEPIKAYLDYADIKMINQETIFGGNDRAFTGFPNFNSPTEVGDAIAKAGFNVVLHASNHTADQQISGLLHCVEFWKKYPEILVTGMFGDVADENEDIGIVEIDGVTFAILNYTYGPNSSTLGRSLQGHLGMLCAWNEKTGVIDFTTIHPDVLTDIKKAEQMADVVIVCPHWGAEYTTVPTRYQEEFAMQMTEAGADVIIGTHPHVVQPVEWIESENGNRALCYYSLGNYVSGQDRALSMLEAMAWVTFGVEEGQVVLLEEETGVIPMVCHYQHGPRNHQVYFLDDYTAELANSHGVRQFGAYLSYEDLLKWTDEILGDWVLDSKNVFPK